MLPAVHRLRTHAEFGVVTRRGVRGSSRRMVVHVRTTGQHRPARVGFIVSKKVGNAVTRNRVTRQLRPLIRQRLDTVADGTDIVIRARPAAAASTSATLATELDAALSAARHRGRGSKRRKDRR